MKVISINEAALRSMVRDEIKSLSAETEKFLDIKQACELLRCSIHSLYKRVGARKVPFYKASGHLLFKESELLEYLQTGKQSPRNNKKEDNQ